jgi:predicted nucleotidyltransferase
MFNEQAAWVALRNAAEDIGRLPTATRSAITGVVVAGSLVRGDFLAERSDVDVYTVLRGQVEQPYDTDAHRAVKSCFDRYFAPYRGHCHHPQVWDDVCLPEAALPGRSEDVPGQQIKALGIYLFDLVQFHRTVWGTDFTAAMPAPPEIRLLVGPRLDGLVCSIGELTGDDAARAARAMMLVVEAVRAVNLLFCEPGKPSLHKRDVLVGYNTRVPTFPMKSFGLALWKDYADERRADRPREAKSVDECLAFLRQAAALAKDAMPA